MKENKAKETLDWPMTGGGGVVREENTNEESTLYSLTIVSLHSSLHPTHTIHHTLHHVLCFFYSASFVLPSSLQSITN